MNIIKTLLVFFLFLFMLLFYCYFNYPFWTYINTTNLKLLTEYNGINIKGYRGEQIIINKNFKEYLKIIDGFAGESELILIITNSYRHENQKLSNTVVTSSKNSNHLVGFAIDFNILYNGNEYNSNKLKKENLINLPKNILDFINKIKSHKNLRWGGDWKTPDPIHIDYPLNIQEKSKWKTYFTECFEEFNSANKKWMFWKNSMDDF